MTIENTIGNQNEFGKFDDVGSWNSNLGDDFAAALGNQGFGYGDIDDFGFPSFQPDSVDFSYPVESTSGLDFELSSLEATIIQLAKGKITGSRGHPAAASAQKIYITHEDFEEGPERDAFLLIYGYAENLFADTKAKEFNPNDLIKTKAIDFFFCRSFGGLHLEDAVNCIDDTIRIDVIRLRFMLEFWLRGWQLPPMPSTADELPPRIEVTAATRSGVIGITLAREAWFHPGINADELLRLGCDDESSKEVIDKVKTALNELVCDYVLSINNGKVYTTGKNPVLELEDRILDPTLSNRNVLANLHWSRKF